MPVITTSNSLEGEQDCDYPDEVDHCDGLTVECICPKCGIAHRMKLLWRGRGKPKKYCPPCKSFVASIEPIDFYGISADIHKSIEKAV